MLFVFGKRCVPSVYIDAWQLPSCPCSAQQLRHKKVSELIHSSDTYPDLQEARVSVHFQTIVDQEGENFEVVPGSEIIISRTATRTNQSKYYMNGRACGWGEITEFVKKAGIDLDNNRFLILQGEVEQIALMKPKAANPNETGLLECASTPLCAVLCSVTLLSHTRRLLKVPGGDHRHERLCA